MRSAFTLIEVVVTFVIMSILIFFSIYSFRYSIANIKRASLYIPKSVIAFSLLDRTISGIYYYAIEKERRVFVDYFFSNSNKMKFITVAPPYGEKVSLVEIYHENKQLIMKYEPLYHKKTDLKELNFTGNYTKRIVLFENIKSFSLSYIIKDKTTVANITNEIPIGIVLKFSINEKNYHFIFAPLSNYNYNKARIYDEKYPL